MSESPYSSRVDNREHPPSLAAIVLCFQLYVLVGAFVSFLGWAADLQRLTDWNRSGISIQPNTTIAAMSAALALILLSRGYPRAATAAGALVFIIGTSVLFEHSSGINLGIDTLLMFGRTWGRVGVLIPGRMGPPGATSWALIGIALVLAARPKGYRSRRFVAVLGLMTASLSSLSLIGYLYGASSLYTIPTLTVIAMQTATFIFCVSAGLIMSVPEYGPMRLLSQPTPAGILARRIVPILIAGPILIGFFRLAGERAGLYDAPFGSALRTLSEITLFLFMLWRTALAIERHAQQRQKADDALQAGEERLKKAREEAFEREHAARAEAERAVRLKDEFLSTVSHELRTPLNAILGWSQLLKKDLDDPETVRQVAEVIDRNGRLQAQLISDLLDMSRILSGKMRLDIQAIDLPTTIDAAIESILPTADVKGVRIRRMITPLPHKVGADPGRIQQMLWNLLSNAVKFTPPGGSVEVEVSSVNTHVEIRVRDTGQGISAEFIPYIFDRFRQADSSTTRSHGGLGIGLALVKQLVELHGGQVRAASDGKGQGATFTIELPVANLNSDSLPDVLSLPNSEWSRPSYPVRLTGIRVLVVDDEPDALAVVRRILEDSEAVVGSALSADEALTLLAAQNFDVIVSDIGMPNCDGYELLAEVRRRGFQIPAIALTAFARPDDQQQSRVLGYQAHVCKPLDIGELLSAIASLTGPMREIARSLRGTVP